MPFAIIRAAQTPKNKVGGTLGGTLGGTNLQYRKRNAPNGGTLGGTKLGKNNALSWAIMPKNGAKMRVFGS